MTVTQVSIEPAKTVVKSPTFEASCFDVEGKRINTVVWQSDLLQRHKLYRVDSDGKPVPLPRDVPTIVILHSQDKNIATPEWIQGIADSAKEVFGSCFPVAFLPIGTTLVKVRRKGKNEYRVDYDIRMLHGRIADVTHPVTGEVKMMEYIISSPWHHLRGIAQFLEDEEWGITKEDGEHIGEAVSRTFGRVGHARHLPNGKVLDSDLTYIISRWMMRFATAHAIVPKTVKPKSPKRQITQRRN